MPDRHGGRLLDRAERWRPVPACRWYGIPAGTFEASTEGHVRVNGQVRPGTPDKDGYLRVKYRERWFAVHVLVVVAFKGPPEARHLGERTDNRPAKLAWGSRWENEQDKKMEEKHRVTVRSRGVTDG
jgi:hypothetical protein